MLRFKIGVVWCKGVQCFDRENQPRPEKSNVNDVRNEEGK